MRIQFFNKIDVERTELTFVRTKSQGDVNRLGNLGYIKWTDSLFETIKGTMIAPQQIQSTENETNLRMIKLGFRVDIPKDCGIVWCRYKASVFPVIPNSMALTPCSIYPERITIQTPIEHRNIFINKGKIELETDGFKPSALFYDQFILGYTNRASVNWDFLPISGMLNNETEHLFVAINTKEINRLRVRSSLLLCITHKIFGEIYLETPPEVRDIR